ncbi:DUF6711 family protein [Hathewaya massiliensis]|uniref:DUF6711 family protein n=1 Tax=Hathewaya massiliensis TaxID=1964382 RepID=UPI00115B997F|nr:DUF6711 family protein [Hathewaya massiliensis]
MISINGVELPAPTDFQVGIMDISKAERNARGSMIIERIATKRKLELALKNLSKEEVSKILKLVSPVFFNVTYVDPQDNSTRTGVFYCGDRNIGMLGFINGQIYYKDVKFNLIER